jgi:hypothetical protein
MFSLELSADETGLTRRENKAGIAAAAGRWKHTVL